MASKSKRMPKAIGVDGAELFDTHCVPCNKNRIATDGVYHCKYCGVMCEKCASKHQKTKKKKGHWAMKFKRVVQAVPKTEFKSVINCEKHIHEHLIGYCIDCGELVCNSCLAESHLECSTETLDKMSADVARESDMREARLELEDIRRRAKQAAKDKKAEMKYLDKQADDFMDKVLKIRDKIFQMLNNMVEIIVKDKNAFCRVEAEEIEKHVLKCQEIEPLVDEAREKLNDTYKTGSNKEFWLALTKLQRLVTHFDGKLTKVENDKCDVNFEFVPSASLAAMLKEPENIGKMRVTTSRVLGERKEVFSKLEMTKTRFKPPWLKNDDRNPWDFSTNVSTVLNEQRAKTSGNNIEIVAPSDGKTETAVDGILSTDNLASGRVDVIRNTKGKTGTKKLPFKEDQVMKLESQMFGENKKIKLSFLGTKEIGLDEDTTENCITGSSYLPNGRLIFVDYNNKNLKLYSSDFDLLSCKFVDERPWDVTHCYSTIVAISYPFVNTVDIVETNTEMKVEGKIKTDRKCHGVAYHTGERWLYVAGGEGLEARLQAYSLDGYIRKVIIPLPGVLHEPCFLAMSPDCKKVFISDLDNGIVGFDTKSGELICQYKDEKVKRYWDLTVDSGGRVLVLTTDPDCLYVIMGQHNGQLLSTFKGKQKVCSVSFDKATKNMVVTRWKADEVEAFRLVYT